MDSTHASFPLDIWCMQRQFKPESKGWTLPLTMKRTIWRSKYSEWLLPKKSDNKRDQKWDFVNILWNTTANVKETA